MVNRMLMALKVDPVFFARPGRVGPSAATTSPRAMNMA
jgi:hypothetical protein